MARYDNSFAPLSTSLLIVILIFFGRLNLDLGLGENILVEFPDLKGTDGDHTVTALETVLHLNVAGVGDP